MKQIVLLYGSPKHAQSATHALLEELAFHLKQSCQVKWFDLSIQQEPALASFRTADAVVLGFPLYFNSVPSHILQFMVYAQYHKPQDATCRIYTLINCGTFEGHHCQWGAHSVRHWSSHLNLPWGQALGVGGGSMFTYTKTLKCMRRSITKGIQTFTTQIISNQSAPDFFVSPNLPRTLYCRISEMYWRKQARYNGIDPHNLSQRW